MLDAVGWANRRIARLGPLCPKVSVLWIFGRAVLVDEDGTTLDVEGEEWEYDSAEAFFPIVRLVLRFEAVLLDVLTKDE